MALDKALAAFEERRRARINHQYDELKALDPDLFRECVQSADAILLNHRELSELDAAVRLRIGADIEARLISAALRAKAGAR